MENSFDFDIKGFDQVWERVSALEKAEKAPDRAPVKTDEAQLREFMEDEASDCAYYRELAKRCGGGRGQRAFLCLASEEAGHLRALQKFYFILTGDTWSPVPTKPYITSVLDAVRQRHLGELSGEKAYREAARETGSRKLSELYLSLAEDEARHAVRTEELIGLMLC